MKYSVAIDLGGTNIGAGIVCENGELIYKTSVSNENQGNMDALFSQIGEVSLQCIRESEIDKSQISFIGIGAPGICESPKGPVIFAPNIHWTYADIVPAVENITNIPVLVGNDADCAAVGEYKLGCGKDYSNFIMLTLGTGIGGAYMVNGKLFPFGKYGGEFGHIPLIYDGVPCNCGKNGCFEVYGSAIALKRETREMAEKHPESLIWQMCENDLQKIGGRTAFDAADMGDETGKIICDTYISYLAEGISGIINIFRPDAVIVGGGVSNQGDSLFDPLNEKVKNLCYAHNNVPVPPVRKASLGNKAGIIGAGLLGF